jgi:hypothetical protein
MRFLLIRPEPKLMIVGEWWWTKRSKVDIFGAFTDFKLLLLKKDWSHPKHLNFTSIEISFHAISTTILNHHGSTPSHIRAYRYVLQRPRCSRAGHKEVHGDFSGILACVVEGGGFVSLYSNLTRSVCSHVCSFWQENLLELRNPPNSGSADTRELIRIKLIAYGAGKVMAKLCVKMMMYCPSLSREREKDYLDMLS